MCNLVKMVFIEEMLLFFHVGKCTSSLNTYVVLGNILLATLEVGTKLYDG